MKDRHLYYNVTHFPSRQVLHEPSADNSRSMVYVKYLLQSSDMSFFILISLNGKDMLTGLSLSFLFSNDEFYCTASIKTHYLVNASKHCNMQNRVKSQTCHSVFFSYLDNFTNTLAIPLLYKSSLY